ncbi:MAG: hypothetical protein IT453_07555 [Planctomycetes bacterium]|nr:hypothetical protein [Planctomycetota bacterium]
MVPPDPVARALVDAAFELHRRRLWLELPLDAPFLVRVPGEPHPLSVAVMGQCGQDYGLFVVRGEDALERFAEFLALRGPRMVGLDLLLVCMAPLEGIPPPLRGVVRAAGLRPRPSDLAPMFVAKPRGESVGRSPTKPERASMLALLRGVLLTKDANGLRVESLHPRARRFLEITVEALGDAFAATTRQVRVELPAEFPTPPLPDLPPDLPRLDESWVVGTPPGRESDFDSPDELSLAVVREADGGRIADFDVSLNDFAAIRDQFAKLVRGDREAQPPGLPREVLFTEVEIQAAVGPLFEAHAVACRWIEHHPRLDDACEPRELVARARGRGRDGTRSTPSSPPTSPPVLPNELTEAAEPTTTLEGWKDADLGTLERLLERVGSIARPDERAFAVFFGGERTAQAVMAQLDPREALGAFCEWHMAHHRPTPRSKTVLERRLAQADVSPVERTILAARSRARVSIFRAVAVRPGESLELEDILDGTRVTVHDRALSGRDLDDVFLPLRVLELGGWRLASFAGPPLVYTEVHAAMQLFEREGVELSVAGIQRRPEVLGWLWALRLSRDQLPVQLTNTDREPFLSHTASFRVADPNAVALGLTSRSDVRHDPERGVWTWRRTGVPAGAVGEHTQLGAISLHDDRLVLEVNSAARFERARAWLEALPGGVEFERVTTREANAELAPLDDRLPSEPPTASPEALAERARLQRETCLLWLDQSVPLLGDRTPRQAAKTAAGRRKVAMMIRTMPTWSSPAGPLEPPRDELLREIGALAET